MTINVTDVVEPPSAPSAPRVTATKDSGWSLDVTWNEPRNTGKPPITDYDIQYRKFKSGNPEDDLAAMAPRVMSGEHGQERQDRQREMPDNDAIRWSPSTQYEVQVRAKNGEGDLRLSATNWSSGPGYDRREQQQAVLRQRRIRS